MIGGWLLKLVVVIAVIGFLVVEAGSPLVAHAQIDGAAHDAADNAAAEYLHSGSVERAQQKCQEAASDKSAKLVASASAPTGCDPDPGDPTVWHVTLEKQARSVLFKKLSLTKKYYDIKVNATSEKRGKTDKL